VRKEAVMAAGSITIITIKSVGTVLSEADRKGFEDHGLIPSVVDGVARKIESEQFLRQVEEAVEKVRAIAERIKGRVGEFEADEITIGLAVSGEGSVGVATVGAEASIEITFKRNKSVAGG
jgi:hypothetical protein